MKKTLEHGGDLQIALLQVRATVSYHHLQKLSLENLSPPCCQAEQTQALRSIYSREQQTREHHDRSSLRELPPLCPGQHVTVLNKERGTWHPTIVLQKCNEPRSYIVQTPKGNKVRRCRSHLRELYNPQKISFAEPQLQNEAHKSHSDLAETSTTPPCETNTDTVELKSPEPIRTRSGRTVTRPAHYKDYV